MTAPHPSLLAHVAALEAELAARTAERDEARKQFENVQEFARRRANERDAAEARCAALEGAATRFLAAERAMLADPGGFTLEQHEEALAASAALSEALAAARGRA